MRRLLAATLLAATAALATPASAGCVEDLTTSRFPRVVELNDDGSVTVYPSSATGPALRFVDCVV